MLELGTFTSSTVSAWADTPSVVARAAAAPDATLRVVLLRFLFIIFKDFIYLFMRDTEREK